MDSTEIEDSKLKELTQPLALIIEDNEIVIELLNCIIGQMGFKVLTARDAQSGINAYKEHSLETSFVLLDYGITGMHCSRLVSELETINSDIKILLASGYSRSFVAHDFPIDSVSVFVPKPFLPKALILEIEKTLKL